MIDMGSRDKPRKFIILFAFVGVFLKKGVGRGKIVGKV